MMRSEWTPVSKAVPRTGYWMVTIDDMIDHCYFQHAHEPPMYKKNGNWVSPGWHTRDLEPVSGVTAWRPLLEPYSTEKPKKRKLAHPGDKLVAASCTLKGKTLIHIDIDGGEPMTDRLIYWDAHRAIDALCEALLPWDIGDPELRLYSQ